MADLTHQKEQRPNNSSPAKSRTSIELKWRGLAVFAASPLLVGVQTQAHGLLSFTRSRYVQWIQRLNKQKFQLSSSSLPSYAKLRIPFSRPLERIRMPIFKTKNNLNTSTAIYLSSDVSCRKSALHLRNSILWGRRMRGAWWNKWNFHEIKITSKCLSFACLFSCQQFMIYCIPKKTWIYSNLYDLYKI